MTSCNINIKEKEFAYTHHRSLRLCYIAYEITSAVRNFPSIYPVDLVRCENGIAKFNATDNEKLKTLLTAVII